VFPKGHQVDAVSMFVEVFNNQLLPLGWHRSATFSITLHNQLNPSRNIVREETHTFFSREADWGFQQFTKLREISDESLGFRVNDTVIFSCTVKYLTAKDLVGVKVAGNWHQSYVPYDSKKETGFVGLKNQGATCYMNSLLQALFHLGSFRKVRLYCCSCVLCWLVG
jgi:ubiquitin carboxyl-terminal hydrolase 7